MYIARSGTTTKSFLERSIINMVKKKRDGIIENAPFKSKKAVKEGKKIKNKNWMQ